MVLSFQICVNCWVCVGSVMMGFFSLGSCMLVGTGSTVDGNGGLLSLLIGLGGKITLAVGFSMIY